MHFFEGTSPNAASLTLLALVHLPPTFGHIMTVIISTLISFVLLLGMVAIITFGLHTLEKSFSLDAVFEEYWFIYLALLVGWIWRHFKYWHVTDSILESLSNVYGAPFAHSSTEIQEKGYVSDLRINNWEGVAQISSAPNGLILKSLEPSVLYIPWKGIKSIFVIIEKSGKKSGKVNLLSSGLHSVALNIEWRDELNTYMSSTIKFLERVRK